jgi:hypothetical protein
MSHRMKLLLVTPALLALGCGDLESPGAPVEHVTYKTNGDIAAFLSRELVTLDGQLLAEKERVAFVGPPLGANVGYEALSADGEIAAVAWSSSEATSDWRVDVFRVSSRAALATVELSQIDGLGLSPAGDLLAVHGLVRDDTASQLHVYATDGGGALWSDPQMSNPFVFSPDGTRLYAAGNASLFLADAGTGNLVTFRPGFGMVSEVFQTLALAASPDGQYLLAAQQSLSTSAYSYAWFRATNLDALGSLPTVPQATGYTSVMSLAVSPDGQRFAAIADYEHPAMPGTSFPPRLQMWTSSGTLLYAIDAPFIGDLSFSPDGSTLVATPYPDPDSPGVSLVRVADGQMIASHTFTTDPL